MRNKMIFRLSLLITLVFFCVVYFVYRLQIKSDPRETIWIPEPGSVNRLPPGDTGPDFKWVQPMGKGPWYKKPIEEKKPVVVESPVHEEPPEPLGPVSRDYTPVEVHIPEGITDPDVKKAWERVQYIADNIWEFGGQPSGYALELIDQLMSAPAGFTGPSAHGDAEEAINLLSELMREGDPRAAETIATYMCEGRVAGMHMENGLVEIGPPAVPYLIPYMLDDTISSILRSRAIRPLGRIAVKHREELGGIVEHIIIPRLEYILSDEFESKYSSTYSSTYDEEKAAREALDRLK